MQWEMLQMSLWNFSPFFTGIVNYRKTRCSWHPSFFPTGRHFSIILSLTINGSGDIPNSIKSRKIGVSRAQTQYWRREISSSHSKQVLVTTRDVISYINHSCVTLHYITFIALHLHVHLHLLSITLTFTFTFHYITFTLHYISIHYIRLDYITLRTLQPLQSLSTLPLHYIPYHTLHYNISY